MPSTAWPLSFRAGTRAGYFLLCLHICVLYFQLLRVFCTCAWPLAALAVALAYAKYSFRNIKDFLFRYHQGLTHA